MLFRYRVCVVLNNAERPLNLLSKHYRDGADYTVFVTSKNMKCFLCADIDPLVIEGVPAPTLLGQGILVRMWDPRIVRSRLGHEGTSGTQNLHLHCLILSPHLALQCMWSVIVQGAAPPRPPQRNPLL